VLPADAIKDAPRIVLFEVEYDHFTSFAVLLGSPFGDDGDGGVDETIYWLNVGFAAGAIVLSVAIIVLYNIYYRKQQEEMSDKLATLGQAATSSSSG